MKPTSTFKTVGTPLFIKKLLQLLRKHWPNPFCELNHTSALELLIGTILAAQSTDKLVNSLTPELFKKYPTSAHWAKASPLDLEREVHSTGFFRNKTRNILGATRMIVEKFGGEVPKTMDELLELPGIGRKSANVILGTIHGISSGIVVDTHMTRLSTERLRLTNAKDPVKIESDLVKLVPQKEWIFFSQAMVLHGRYICVARRPKCYECKIRPICPYPDKTPAPDTNA